MKKLTLVGFILMMLAGCGSTYTLKKGGWAIQKDAKKGTCLTVHGDGDPEVVVASCPKCPELVPVKAEEKTDGAD